MRHLCSISCMSYNVLFGRKKCIHCPGILVFPALLPNMLWLFYLEDITAIEQVYHKLKQEVEELI